MICAVTIKAKNTVQDFDDRMIQQELSALKGAHKGWGKLDTKGKTAYMFRAMARQHGRRYLVANAEGFNAHSGHKSDMFGLFDLIVITREQTIGVQAAGTDWAQHVSLYQGDRREAACLWLECPRRRFELWGWRRLKGFKKDGSRAALTVLTPKVQVLSEAFLRGSMVTPEMIYPFSRRD